MHKDKLSLDGIEAVIFDLDGSLVDSTWMWQEIDDEYLGRFGIIPPEDLHSCIGGKTFSETAVFFKETFALPDEIEQIKSDWKQMAWDKYSNEVMLKDGALNFLNICMEKNIKLGIATSNSRELVENLVAVHGIGDYFSSIMTGTDGIKGKPAPDIYLAVAGELNVMPQHCLVFEDIIHGIMAGKAAGMKVCAVYDEASVMQDDEKRELADFYIHDYRELLQENGIFTNI